MARGALKGLAIKIAAASGIQYLSTSPEKALTALLYHNFFFDGEAKGKGRDRLKRQLDWLRQNYTLVDLRTATEKFATQTLPPRSLLITIDDVEADLLDVYDIFNSWEVPLALFICVGWASQDKSSETTLLARVVSAIEWYSGPDFTVALGNGSQSLRIGRDHTTSTIEQLISRPDEFAPYLHQIADRLGGQNLKIGNRACNWSELSDLAHGGVQFGAHSVSHVPLAAVSRLRMAFEIGESKRLTEEHLGPCSVFAYPYGMTGTFNATTTDELKKAKFRFAFLTETDFISASTDPLHLPRIALPDHEMSLPEFRARVKGGGIVMQKGKKLLHRFGAPSWNAAQELTIKR